MAHVEERKMKNKLNLEEAIKQNNYSELSNFINESINKLKVFFDALDLVELENEIERKKSNFSFLVKKEIVEKNVHFLFGRYIGYIDFLYEQLAKEYKEKGFKESLASLDISDIPHVNDIMVTIYQQEGIRHGALAEKVGIEKSTLSGIMDKLVKKGAVRFSRPGKYKYYYLTELGNRYYINNRAIIEAETNIDALTEQLLLALSKEEDANGKLIQIITALCDGKNVFKGYKSNTQEKVNPSMIFAGIPTIKQLHVMFPDTSIHTVNDASVLSLNSKSDIISLFNNNSNNLVEYPGIPIIELVNA